MFNEVSCKKALLSHGRFSIIFPMTFWNMRGNGDDLLWWLFPAFGLIEGATKHSSVHSERTNWDQISSLVGEFKQTFPLPWKHDSWTECEKALRREGKTTGICCLFIFLGSVITHSPCRLKHQMTNIICAIRKTKMHGEHNFLQPYKIMCRRMLSQEDNDHPNKVWLLVDVITK